MNLPVGTLLRGGTYRIVRFIDSGGFGRTYEAEHLMLQKRVAIKEFFVKDFCARNENTSYVVVGIKSKEPLVDKLKSKFVDEARAVSRFRHAGIVQVSDVFEENGTAYYVMDYIEGSSLKDIVRSEGPLSERRALKYIFQVADALKYVHEHNRLHLDVKPGNIMVDGSDNAILIDFGTSKQYDEVSGENTSTLLGHTPGYAPPEQMSKSVMNFLPATDIYALGAALYNLLTGKTPPDANDRISGTMLDPLPASVSDCVRRAVEESMRLNKSQRPQCIEEFLAILRGGEQAKSETKQARPSGTSRPADDSTVWYENNNVGGASNERRSDKGDRSGGGNDKVAKGGVSDKPSSSPNRAKRWIIVACVIFCLVAGVVNVVYEDYGSVAACVIVGIVAGYFLLKSLKSGGGYEIQADGTINGHEWIDLGLSAKWATCNVGASSPSDYGDYYAWGETKTKSEYTEDNFCANAMYLGDISGDIRYDAARANWGDTWRLPTQAEIQDLLDRCDWKWINQGGHNGYRVTGPSGKSIFLPAAGYRTSSLHFADEEGGLYWSSTPNESHDRRAVCLYFSNPVHNQDWDFRGLGSIRPVSD